MTTTRTHAKSQGKGPSVQKLEWKGTTEAIALPPVHLNNAVSYA